MDRKEYKNILDLAIEMDKYVHNSHSDDEYNIVSAYVPYEIAKELVETLVILGNHLGAIVELEDYEMSNYDKEYVIYLSPDGIASEKIYHEDGYYYGGGDISYVHEDCNSKLLNYVDSKYIYEFGFVEDNEDECECSECTCHKDEKPVATTSKSVYKVNGKEVSEKEYLKELDKFSDKYMGNIQDMLLNHLEFLDEMRSLERLFNW